MRGGGGNDDDDDDDDDDDGVGVARYPRFPLPRLHRTSAIAKMSAEARCLTPDSPARRIAISRNA